MAPHALIHVPLPSPRCATCSPLSWASVSTQVMDRSNSSIGSGISSSIHRSVSTTQASGKAILNKFPAQLEGRIVPLASKETQVAPVFSRRHLLLSCLLPLWLTQQNYALADQAEEDDRGELDIAESKIDKFGFDGLGTSEDDYAVGKVVALAQAGDGAVLFLGVDGFDLPLRMVVGAAEAMAILTAAQERRSRRPVTHEAWGSTLAAVGWKVDHVAITSMESDVFYSRLVLSLEPSAASLLKDRSGDGLPKGERFRSVDMRPSDAIALALRCRAPLFISKKVAEEIVGALKKGPDPAKRQSDPLERPGLQARRENIAPDSALRSWTVL